MHLSLQAGLVLCDFFLHSFTLMWLETLHHFSNLRDYFLYNMIWRRHSFAALIFCRRLAVSGITVTPLVMYVDWLCWWYSDMAHLVSLSTALAFLTNMSENCQSTSPSPLPVKNHWKTISIEEKLDVISSLEIGEQIVDMWHNVRLAHSSVQCTYNSW